MSLSNLIRSTDHKESGRLEIDKEKIRENLPYYQKLIAYWRKYPDKFVDYLCSLNPDNTFHFYTIQRLALRVMMRYKTSYLVFSRGFSKSFLAVLAGLLKCILYPGANIAEVADQKGQSSSILQSKADELMRLIPALRQEVQWDTKGQIRKTMTTKDAVSYVLKNGFIINYWLI